MVEINSRKHFKTFRGPQQTGVYLLKYLGENRCKLISFDVFETLVHRRIHPDAIIDGVCKWLHVRLIERGMPIVSDIREARERAYVKLIHTKAAEGLDLEAALDAFTVPWLRECVGSGFEGELELAKSLAEVECDFEIRSCYCCPDFLALATLLKNRGCRLVFTSDMYLGIKYVQRILNAAGYKNLFAAGYVSGDHSMLKRTGRLFDILLKHENVLPSEVVHIGDNVISDGVRPSERSIHSLVHVNKSMVKRHKRMEYDLLKVKQDPSWMGVVAAQYAEAGLADSGPPQLAYGMRILGPIYTSFVHKVAERCKQERIDRVFFMAREGYVLKQMYDQLAPRVVGSGRCAPPSEYLAVSRLTAYLAAIKSYSLRAIWAALDNTPHYSVRSLFAPLRLDENILNKIASRYGLQDVNAHLPHFFMKWSPIIKLLEDPDLGAIVESKSNETCALLTKYFDSLGFFECQRVALIDVGWSGQIQDNLHAAIKNHPKCPQIFGMYLGTSGSAHWRKSPLNWIEWTLADKCHLGWSGMAAFDFVQGLESVIRAPHGTVIGYRDKGSNEVTAVLKRDDDHSRRAEIEDEPTFALFQEGMRRYCKHYVDLLDMFQFSAFDVAFYAKAMICRMLRFPTRQEVVWLSSINNVSDLGSSDVLKLGPQLKPSILRPKQLWKILQRCFWRHGLMAQCGGRIVTTTFAALSTLWSIPKKTEALDPGIVFHEYEDAKSQSLLHRSEKGKTSELIQLCERQHKNAVALGLKKSGINNLHGITGPLKLSEVLQSFAAFRLAQIVCKASGRHIPYQDGLSVRPWISRQLHATSWSLAAKNILKRLLHKPINS